MNLDLAPLFGRLAWLLERAAPPPARRARWVGVVASCETVSSWRRTDQQVLASGRNFDEKY
jgi:hypothetical protein